MQTTVPTPGATVLRVPDPLPGPSFRVLGLLQVRGREPVVVTARRQQVVLALLLLNGNRVVPLETLLDALWGAEPPATAWSMTTPITTGTSASPPWWHAVSSAAR